ncbi:MAG: hypothetical protein HRU19_19670 [Pseudobacteriovorax sp.]|nr:hypothetical protein [Pseudobacteriovorax sp.]
MVILKILTYVFIGGLGSVGTFPVAFASAKSKADLITIYISEVPPFASVHPDSGQPQGYFPELFRVGLKKAKLKSEFRVVPLPRYNKYFMDGELDIGFWPWTIRLDSHKQLNYVGTADFGYVGKKDLDLKNSYGCATSNTPISWTSPKLIYLDSYDRCFRVMAKGRVDYVYGIKSAVISSRDAMLPEKESAKFHLHKSERLHLYIHNRFKAQFSTIRSSIEEFDLASAAASYGLRFEDR